ncbi:hypothetical protein ON010_g18495 [Phytophthora cinnamomi]|nr:hypothetical protein ON010_g18495 [Phytophthora cinnamomi]
MAASYTEAPKPNAVPPRPSLCHAWSMRIRLPAMGNQRVASRSASWKGFRKENGTKAHGEGDDSFGSLETLLVPSIAAATLPEMTPDSISAVTSKYDNSGEGSSLFFYFDANIALGRSWGCDRRDAAVVLAAC